MTNAYRRRIKVFVKKYIPAGISLVRFVRSVVNAIYYSPLIIHLAISSFFNTKNTASQIWLYNLFQCIVSSHFDRSVLVMTKEIMNTKISIVMDRQFNVNNKKLLAICIVRNDLKRIKQFLIHYRKLGVDQFAILDDQSTDGTKEYLLAQDDIELFECDKRYTSRRRDAWINLMMDYYGFDRWYLIVDSDELLVYDNCEQRNISFMVGYLKNKGITACNAITIDMYSKDNKIGEAYDNPYTSINYFDKSGYDIKDNRIAHEITGGMRKRCFGLDVLLHKTPLFLFDDKTVYISPHHLFPFYKNHLMSDYLALLHYKFLQGDLEEYRERIKNNNMTDGHGRTSIRYIVYVEELEKQISFYNADISVKYEDSTSLVKHNLIKKIV
jgi:hypothetical protein